MVLWELHLWLWELNFGFGNGNIVDLNEYGALGIVSLALGIDFWFGNGNIVDLNEYGAQLHIWLWALIFGNCIFGFGH